MATDATGTPSSPLGIPKYNPSVDAPSGIGLNNIVDAIDDAIEARIPKSLGTASGDIMYWSASGTPARLAKGTDGHVLTLASGLPSWAASASASTPGFREIAVDLRNPQTASNAGNAFPAVVTETDWESWSWEFLKDVDGKIYGLCHVPDDITVGTPKLALFITANATSGATRLIVSTKAVADGESMNPGALTSETAQDITVPGTAKLLKKVTFTLTETVVAGDTLIVEVFHEGSHANDTLAVNTRLHKAVLELD